MVSLAAHARSRRVLAGLVLAATLHRRLSAPAPVERTVDALVGQLGEAAGAVVLPGDLAWEPSRGALLDLLLGRGVLFLAARGEAGERDVLRARVGVTPEGHPLGVRAVASVTRTPLADESGLEVRGGAAVFAATAAGTVRAVTVLGVEPRLGDVLSTRALSAPRRVDLVPVQPPPRTELTFTGGSVRVEFPGAERPVDIDLEALEPGPAGAGSGVEILARPTSAGALMRELFDELGERYPALGSARERARAGPEVPRGAAARESGPGAFPPPGAPFEALPPPGLAAAVEDVSGEALTLLAVDLRVATLEVVGGHALPPAPLGPPGRGRVETLAAPAAALLAAFEVDASEAPGVAGLTERGRELSPPVAGVPTLLVTAAGLTGLAPYDPGSPLARRARSLLQIGAPEAAETDAPRGRSALCVTEGRHLVHLSGRTTAGAMEAAGRRVGCAATLVLAAAPHRVAPSVAVSPGGPLARLGGLGGDPARFLHGSRAAFVAVRERSAAATAAALGLTLDESTGLARATLRVGALPVEVVALDPARHDVRLTGGVAEPREASARPRRERLPPELAARVVLSVGLGSTTDALRYGLSFDGEESLALRRAYATLVLPAGQPPRAFGPGVRPPPVESADAVQLPLLASRRGPGARAIDLGGERDRGAACVDPEGRLLLATTRHDSADPLVVALTELGCETVLALDRGSRDPATVLPPGQAPTPGDTSFLHVLRAPARGAALAVTPPLPPASAP